MDIEVQELKQKLDAKESFIFIDVREIFEYDEFNLGARNVPLAEMVNLIPELSDQKEEEIVVHCRSGQRSGIAKQLLERSGFKNVRNLIGGVLAWQEM